MSLEQAAVTSTIFLKNAARSPETLRVAPDIVDLLPVAIYACDAGGRILWFNERAADMWGRKPRLGDDDEKFCGSFRLFFDGRQVPLSECPMAMALRTGEAVRGVEGRIERPDGSSVWAMMHIEPVTDASGALIGAINCFHPATARHPGANEVEDFFENAAVPMHIVSRGGTILRANQAELRMLGYGADEYIGKSIIDFHADRPTIDDILKRLLRNESICEYPARLRAKDGSIRDVEVTSNVRVVDGDVVNTRCLTVDVTDRKRAENELAQRLEEQAALYEFTEQLQRARSFDEVYDAALDAIARALRCERASILLFDQSKTMRFVAWRGLSDGYRRAVEGHSPWTFDTKNPEPLCINDVDAAGLGEELTQTVKAEAIRSLAFIPLFESGQLLGKFMIYYGEAHRFSDAEIDAALSIARQLGFRIERMRASIGANRLAAIVESSEDAIISKDLDGTITSWNTGAERIFGYTREEIVGQSVTLLIPSDRIDEEPHILSRIRAGERVDHYETLRKRKDGSLVAISLTVSPVRDATGRIVGASKISRDISDRKRAEAELENSKRQLQDLLAAIPAAIYTTDAHGKITYFNEAAVALAGRTPTLGSDEWCVTWKLYWPDGTFLPHDQCPMAIALKEGRPVRGVEAVAERPDGTRVPFIPYPTPLRDKSGKVIGAINMLVDISERKQAESNQHLLLNELNHRVKNNMQMVQSLLDGAAKSAKGEEARRVFAEASRRIAAMASAQRVLYSTTSATHFDAAEFLAAVCKTFQDTFAGSVKVDWEDASGKLSNDVAMPLALILNELLTNAFKHGGNGRDATIRAGLVEKDGAFTLYVEDCGSGFDLGEVHRRSSGLRLVEGLARQMRGEFAVSRNPSRCTVKFLKVPS